MPTSKKAASSKPAAKTASKPPAQPAEADTQPQPAPADPVRAAGHVLVPGEGWVLEEQEEATDGSSGR